MKNPFTLDWEIFAKFYFCKFYESKPWLLHGSDIYQLKETVKELQIQISFILSLSVLVHQNASLTFYKGKQLF